MNRNYKISVLMTQQGLEPHSGTCGALLNAFASRGEVMRCHQISEYMKRNNIGITHYDHCTLMKCYIFGGDPVSALRIYEDFIKPILSQFIGDRTTLNVIAGLRMSCYAQMIENEFAAGNGEKLGLNAIERVEGYFRMIMQEIPFEVKVEGQYEDNNFYKYLGPQLVQRMLNTLIVMHENGGRMGKQ